jgi:hypothetical protein
MKSRGVSIVALFFVMFLQTAFSQEKIKVPEPPNYDFEYHEFFKMSEDDEKELLKNINKDLKKELEVIKTVNKERYFDFLRQSQYKNMAVPFLVKREKLTWEREQKIFEAEVKAEALAAKYSKAKQTEKENIKRNLREELKTLFDQKEERRREEVAELEKQLQELRKSLEVRQKNKNQIIERRIQELLEEDEYLEWD